MEKSREAYLKGLPPVERATALREIAVKQYSTNVVHYYTEDELSGLKNKLSEVAINYSDTVQEKKEMTAEVNQRLKAIRTEQSSVVKAVKNKYYESLETVFDVDNQQDGIMETYDINGNLLSSRKLTPQEKQTNIHHLTNTKTA